MKFSYVTHNIWIVNHIFLDATFFPLILSRVPIISQLTAFQKLNIQPTLKREAFKYTSIMTPFPNINGIMTQWDTYVTKSSTCTF